MKKDTIGLEKFIPLEIVIALIFLFAGIVLHYLKILELNEGAFIYSADDCYIHMAIAKNFAAEGVWGVTPHSFSSSSSSLLWTLLLSTFIYLFGNMLFIPFVLNIFSAACLLIVSERILMRFGVNRWGRIIALLLIIFFAPLLPLIFGGLEHATHALLILLFVDVFIRTILAEKNSKRGVLILILLSFALTGVRYESIFIVGIASGLAILKRRWGMASLFIIFAAMPIIIYGFYSVSNGGFFLPNPVLVKGSPPFTGVLLMMKSILGKSIINTFVGMHLVALAVGAALIFRKIIRKGEGFWKPAPLLLFIFIATSIAHLVLARVGDVIATRYVSYLIVLGTIALVVSWGKAYPEVEEIVKSGLTWKKIGPLLKYTYVFLILLFFPLYRGLVWTALLPKTANEIYLQQFQMARFISRYYNEDSIAANDIGAISYYTKLKLLDIAALASKETANLYLHSTYTPEALEKIADHKGVRLIVAYEKWVTRYAKGIPSNWLKAGEWTIPTDYLVDGKTVSFYVRSNDELRSLKTKLKDFSRLLPKKVKVMSVR